MIVQRPKQFINDASQVFNLPFEGFEEYRGIYAIIELKSKAVISFSLPDGHESEHRTVVCFDRHSSEVLWQIEKSYAWEVPGNRNMYLADELEDGVILYGASAISGYYKSSDGHTWIEELFNKGRTRKIWDLEKNGFVVPHPDYRNDEKYKIRESGDYYIHKDTHELVLTDLTLPLEERAWIDGAVSYTDLTDKDESDCLLSVTSNYGAYVFEVDIQTGMVKPAYANIAEDK